MKNNKKQKKYMYLLIILLVISLGYALISTTLRIRGTANLSKNTFDIHWENLNVKSGSAEATQAAEITSPTVVEFSVMLNEPGQYYEFTVDAKNDGLVDGILQVISIDAYEVDGETKIEDEDLPSFVSKSFGLASGQPIEENHILRIGKKEKYKVRVEYTSDIEAEDLEKDFNCVFKFKAKYIQGELHEEEPEYVPKTVEELIEIGNELGAGKTKHPDQIQSNDIGITEDGVIINLDAFSSYYIKNSNEMVVGSESGSGAGAYIGQYNSDGSIKTPIPAYIKLAGTDDFLPVTEVNDLFYFGDDIKIMPQLPTTVSTIGQGFIGNATLEGEITIPRHVTTLSYGAFYYDNFDTVIIPKHISLQDNNSFISGTVNHLIVNSINISDYAFQDLEITNLTLSENTQTIGYSAFNNYGNTLSSFIIPESVTEIGYEAFHGYIEHIYVVGHESKPNGWNNEWFYNSASNSPRVHWGCDDTGNNCTRVEKIGSN